MGVEKAKVANIEKIRSFVSGHASVTNAEITELLGVNDATVVRYMDELEKDGVVRQVGETGVEAYYEKVN
ncbi:MAG: winged helix-turn-helix transcriptional regulator [Candidatus Berkelbacteria bacterium]